MAELDLTAAVEAATKVLVGPTSHLLTPADVQAAIEAAAPLIEKALREQIAAELEAAYKAVVWPKILSKGEVLATAHGGGAK